MSATAGAQDRTRRKCLYSLFSAILACTLTPPRAARAQAELDGVRLDWRGSEHCPQPADIMTEMRSLLGPAHGDPPQLAVQADVSELPGGGLRLVFRAERRERRAQRELSLASCQDAGHAVALLIAMALDSFASRTSAELDAPVEAAVPANPAPKPAPAQPPPTAASPPKPALRPSHPGPSLGLAGGVDPWAMPQLLAAITPRLAWRSADLELEADASVWLPGSKRARADQRYTLNMLGAGVFACYWFGSSRFELGPALGVELSKLTASLGGPLTRSQAWVRIWLGARASLWLTSVVRLTLSLEAYLAPKRLHFFVDNDISLRTPSAGFVPRLAVSVHPW